jgi:hypothetical protein
VPRSLDAYVPTTAILKSAAGPAPSTNRTNMRSLFSQFGSVISSSVYRRKKDPSYNTPISAALETIGIVPPSKNATHSPTWTSAHVPTKSTNSALKLGSPSSIVTSSSTSAGSLSFQPSLASSSKHVSNPRLSQQLTTEKAIFDFSASIFVSLRKEPVSKLTGRVRDISTRPVFEGAYSNVWTGIMDGSQKVSSQHLALCSLLMTRRSQSSVFETSQSEKRRPKGSVLPFLYLLYLCYT